MHMLRQLCDAGLHLCFPLLSSCELALALPSRMLKNASTLLTLPDPN